MKIIKIILIIVVIMAVAAGTYYITRTRNTLTNHASSGRPRIEITEGMIRRTDGQIVERLQGFPVIPGATLQESSERLQALDSNQDLRAVWTVSKTVPEIMNWYIDQLKKDGWRVQPPDDPKAQGEQVAQISKGVLSGYIAAEVEEGGVVEIVVDFKDTSR